MPESASAAATLATAEICGTPMPVTIRVVQIEPGPIPTFTASAPASRNARAASAVAILPPITSIRGYASLIMRTRSKTFFECPWAVSTTNTSTPARTSASVRSSVSGLVPTDAPTRNCPDPSLQAWGNDSALSKSLTVIRPFKVKSSSITNIFSMRN